MERLEGNRLAEGLFLSISLCVLLLLLSLFSRSLCLRNAITITADLVTSARDFQRKIIRANTKASYTQQKYNLLREESEGIHTHTMIVFFFAPVALSTCCVSQPITFHTKTLILKIFRNVLHFFFVLPK